jgi:hypothetical protein
MHIYTVQHWQENWDELLSRVEDGEHIGVTNGENTAVMTKADIEILRIHTDHDDAS